MSDKKLLIWIDEMINNYTNFVNEKFDEISKLRTSIDSMKGQERLDAIKRRVRLSEDWKEMKGVRKGFRMVKHKIEEGVEK